MSEPKRYGHKAIIYPKADDDTYITIPVEEPDGHWITYADYARLKAEVERLRKAGDALAEEIIGCYRGEGYDPADSETLPKWKAAKEGKPSA